MAPWYDLKVKRARFAVDCVDSRCTAVRFDCTPRAGFARTHAAAAIPVKFPAARLSTGCRTAPSVGQCLAAPMFELRGVCAVPFAPPCTKGAILERVQKGPSLSVDNKGLALSVDGLHKVCVTQAQCFVSCG